MKDQPFKTWNSTPNVEKSRSDWVWREEINAFSQFPYEISYKFLNSTRERLKKQFHPGLDCCEVGWCWRSEAAMCSRLIMIIHQVLMCRNINASPRSLLAGLSAADSWLHADYPMKYWTIQFILLNIILLSNCTNTLQYSHSLPSENRKWTNPILSLNSLNEA